jgi:multidrug efflux pump subunit AcrB
VNLSSPFIYRRIGTCLLAIGVILVGLVAYRSLPISSMPQVEYPTISVSASLPGASADTMATSVATPLERMLTNIPGVTQMTSSSSLGQTQITLQFDLARDINGAAVDVQTEINAAAGLLPKNMPNPPTYHKVNPAGVSIISLALTSDTLPLTEVDRYAENNIAQPISQLSGVGLVDYHGQLRPAVRVRVEPDRLAALNLSLEDVRSVISASTVNAPKGTLNGPHQAIVLATTDQLMNAAAYRNVVVATRNGAPIRLSDVATVENAPEDVRQAAWFQGKRAVIIDVAQSPRSNVMSTLQGIKDRLPALAAALPPSVHLDIVADRTQTIKASVNDVQVTLMITIALVVMVILVFLRNLWATLIPSLTIPLSLIATFAVMYALGYSLDNLADGADHRGGLCGRRCHRRHRKHHAPCGRGQDAAGGRAARLARGGFHHPVDDDLADRGVYSHSGDGGLIGRIFREFAVTITVALIASGVVSLTVTPMLCGWLIREEHKAQHGRFYRWSEHVFTRMTQGYEHLLNLALRRQGLTMLSFMATLVVTVGLYVALPKGFFRRSIPASCWARCAARPISPSMRFPSG